MHEEQQVTAEAELEVLEELSQVLWVYEASNEVDLFR